MYYLLSVYLEKYRSLVGIMLHVREQVKYTYIRYGLLLGTAYIYIFKSEFDLICISFISTRDLVRYYILSSDPAKRYLLACIPYSACVFDQDGVTCLEYICVLALEGGGVSSVPPSRGCGSLHAASGRQRYACFVDSRSKVVEATA